MQKSWIIGIVGAVLVLSGYWIYKVATSPSVVIQTAIEESAKVVEEVKKVEEEQGWVDWAISKLPSFTSDETEKTDDETPNDIINRQLNNNR